MDLVDTNVWLELLLEQERAKKVRSLFKKLEPRLTELSLYSIGIIMDKLKRHEAFLDFVRDAIEDSGVTLVRIEVKDMDQLMDW